MAKPAVHTWRASSRIRTLRAGADAALAWATVHPREAEHAVLGLWLATRLLLLAVLVLTHAYCDPAFYNYAGQFAAGRWPYRDVPVEYPPGAMLLLLLPALPLLPFAAIAPRPDAAFAGSFSHLPAPDPLRYGAYAISFAAEMLLIDALTLWLVRRATRRLLPTTSAPQRLAAMMLYVVLIVASGALLQKFDLAVGALCLASVLALLQRRPMWSGAALGAATLLKGFPLLALPLLLAVAVAQSAASASSMRTNTSRAEPSPQTQRTVSQAAHPLQRWRQWAGVAHNMWRTTRANGRDALCCALGFAAVLASVTALVLLGAGVDSVKHSILYHVGRQPEIESVYANLLMAVGWLPGLGARTAFHQADLSRVVLSPLDTWVGVVSFVLTAATLLGTYAALARLLSHTAPGRELASQAVCVGMATLLLAFLLTFRALPAHYLLTVVPFAAVVRLPRWTVQRLWLGGVFAAALLGQLVAAPLVWQQVVHLAPWAIVLLSIRNIGWCLAFAALLVTLWRWPAEASHRTF